MAGNGMKPSALSSVIPGQDEEQQVDQLQAALKFNPAAPVQGAPPQAPEQPMASAAPEDDLIAQMDAEVAGDDLIAQMDAELSTDPVKPDFAAQEAAALEEMSGMTTAGPQAFKEQQIGKASLQQAEADSIANQDFQATYGRIQEVPSKVRAGLSAATNPEQKEAYLKMLYPASTINKIGKEDNYEIIQPDGSKLVVNQEGRFSKGDLADYATSATGLLANVVTQAGIDASAILAAPATGGTSLAAAAASGVAGAYADQTVRQLIARQLGVPGAPPAGSVDMGDATALVLGGLFNVGGKALMNSIAGRVENAANAKILGEIAGSDTVKKMNSSLDVIDEAVASGKLVPTAQMPNVLTSAQLAGGQGDAAAADFLGEEASMQGNRVFNSALGTQKKVLGDYFNNVISGVADLGNATKETFSKTYDALKSNLTLEGQKIGNVTKRIVLDNPDEVVDLPGTRNLFTPQAKWTDADGVSRSIPEDIGLNFKEGGVNASNAYAANRAGTLVITDVKGNPVDATPKAISEKLKNFMGDEMSDRVGTLLYDLGRNIYGEARGELTLQEANLMRRRMEALLRSAYSKEEGGAYGMLKSIKDAFTDDFLVTAEKFVPPGEIKSYAQDKAAYATSKRVENTLVKLLGNKDDLFDADFYKKVFESKDPATLPNVVAALGGDPASLKNLAGGYFKNILETADGNFYEAAKKISKLPETVQKQLADAQGMDVKELTNMFKVMAMAEKTLSSPTVTANGAETAMTGMILATQGAGGAAQAGYIRTIMDKLGNNKRIMDYLAGKSASDLVKNVKGDKTSALQAAAEIVNYVKNKRSDNPLIDATLRMTGQATQQKVRDTIRGQ